MTRKTVRLVFPEWQGGVNPNYSTGAEVLALIAPKGQQSETLRVPVAEDFSKPLEYSDGYYAKTAILEQQKAAYAILEKSKADRVITFGGDCSVSQAPFDYLHGQYREGLGILWIDAHPDLSEPSDTEHEHAMVLGNLLGGGAAALAKNVQHPFSPNQVMYAGLIEDKLLDYERERLAKYQIPVTGPEEIAAGNHKIVEWLRKNQFKHLLVHFDLDALSPTDFRSLLCNEPHTPPVDYAVGKLTLTDVVRLLVDVSKDAEIVGLTIAEYLPWDIINMKQQFARLDIFAD